MATIYIDPSLSTNGDGSLATPFNTWLGLTWTAGNNYLQKRGTTFNGQIGRITIGATGTLGNPITLGAYGDATLPKPVLDGQHTRDIAIIALNHAYINIEDFEIKNYTRCGPYFSSTGDDGSIVRNIRCSRLHIHDILVGALGSGFYWWGSGVTVEDCLIERVADDGIWLDGRNATIRRNIIRDTSFYRGGQGDCIQYGGNWADGAIIEDNILDHRNNTDKQCLVIRGGLESSIAYNIRRNQFLGNVSGAGCLSVDTTPATTGRGIIEQNLFMSNRGARWAIADTGGENSIVRNNVFISTGDGNSIGQAILFKNCTATNNTIIGFWRGIDVTTGVAENNCFLNLADFDHTSTNPANLRNSVYWNIGRHAPTGEGVGNQNVNPNLIGNGIPTSTSILLTGVGANLGWQRDIEGRLGKAYIGAYSTITTGNERGVR